MTDPEQARTVTIRDRDGSLEASFVPGIGMVLASLRHDGEELLGQRNGLEGYVAKGSTFAIPLLYPWANRLYGWEYTAGGKTVKLDPEDPLVHQDTSKGIPMHGLLSGSPHWQITDADLDLITAELDFAAVDDYMRSFPFAHRISYRAKVENGSLTVTLTVTPTGKDAVPISFGFHPYFKLPGSRRDDWLLREPIAPEKPASPLCGQAFDTQYTELVGREPAFTLADDRRRLTVTFADNYPVAVAYSPLGSDSICLEPMTAPTDALRTGQRLRWAQPGEPFSATFSITAVSV